MELLDQGQQRRYTARAAAWPYVDPDVTLTLFFSEPVKAANNAEVQPVPFPEPDL